MIKQFWNPSGTYKICAASLSWQYDFLSWGETYYIEVEAVWSLCMKQIPKKRVVCVLLFHNLFSFVFSFSFLKDYCPCQIILLQSPVLIAGTHADHKGRMLFNLLRSDFPAHTAPYPSLAIFLSLLSSSLVLPDSNIAHPDRFLQDYPIFRSPPWLNYWQWSFLVLTTWPLSLSCHVA